ncbi:MAG TPA: twin-arginine translocase TatA/TatE family subunit [Nitrospiraceae bacterium]|nr:twin-arginine translocase TatA/TatE family subunit [Nitrospiraceae bacterium]
MFGVGIQEVILLFIITLVLFGGSRLSQIGTYRLGHQELQEGHIRIRRRRDRPDNAC